MRLPFRIVGLQVGVVAVVAVLTLLNGVEQALSVVLGGTVVVLPNTIFAYSASRALLRQGKENYELAAIRFFGSGVSKIVLTAILMAATLRFVRIEPWSFFVAMMAALFTPAVVGAMNWKR